jgi:Uma2 family endonuclease
VSRQLARFNVEQYERMIEVGVFPPDRRAELIVGLIFEKPPMGKRHAACVDALAEQLRERLGRGVNIRVQSPIRLDDNSEPQPDLAALKRREDFYRNALPTAADILLLIEVSDTTLEYDRQRKLPLYARAGVPEVWIVNLVDNRIETRAEPAGGAYRLAGIAGRGEELRSRAVDGLSLDVSAVLV